METVHSTERSEQTGYKQNNTRQMVHYKDSTVPNLYPHLGTSLVTVWVYILDVALLTLYLSENKQKQERENKVSFSQNRNGRCLRFPNKYDDTR